jgi:CRP/FNR family cyclic AMP-dependent transcriptional regulator
MGAGDLVPRIITGFGVRLRCPGDDGFCRAWPTNLSETGACLRLNGALPVGQCVELQIKLTNQAAAMEVSGRIVWVREDPINRVFYYGLGFTNLTDDQLQQIRAYVELGGKWLVKFLLEFPLFEEFSYGDCRWLLRIVTLRDLQKGEVLYQEGTCDVDLQGLFIVQSGLLSIFEGRTPRPEQHLAVVSRGQVFGETSLVNDRPHSATVMAVNDSGLIQVNRMGLLLMRKEQPQLAFKIMEVVARTLAARLGRTTKKLFSPARF